MWAVEARNYGDNPDFFYISGLSQKEARKLHAQLSNSGEWASCRSWDKVVEWEMEKTKVSK